MRWIDTLAAWMTRRTKPATRTGLAWPFVTRAAGKPVTESQAFTLSAFWCCVRVVSETIAQMPWRIHEETDQGARVATAHPADRLLNRQPNEEMDAAVWRELMLRWCMTWGNAYSEIVRDQSFRPVALWPVEPWRVTPERTPAGLAYRVQQPSGEPVMIPAADMLHFRGLGDELEGWSVIHYAARCLGLGVAQEDSMCSQMEHGARLSGLLVPPGGGSLPAPKAETILKEWRAQNTGSGNHGKVILMSQGLEFHALSMPNTDAQLLESRQLSVVDICRFCRVPPHMAYDLARATFSNITHQSLEFSVYTLGPWVVKFEQQANRKLISRARFYSKINQAALLRADPQTRVAFYRGLRDLGAISPNEIRQLEDMNTLGPAGDKYLVPLNMTTLDQAGQPQPSSAPAADPLADPDLALWEADESGDESGDQ